MEMFTTAANNSINSVSIPCHECFMCFSCIKDYTRHIAQHKWGPHQAQIQDDGSMIFLCLFPACDKVLQDRKVLRKHLLAHKEKIYACTHPYCDKRFYERSKLKRHQLVHTREKKFHCSFPTCDKVFGLKANMKKHIKSIHIERKPEQKILHRRPSELIIESNQTAETRIFPGSPLTPSLHLPNTFHFEVDPSIIFDEP